MLRVLHFIQSVNEGGGSRCVIAASKYSSRTAQIQHRVISLSPASREGLALAQAAGLTVIEVPDPQTLQQEVEQADIVQIDYWNFPKMHALLRSDLPAMRLLIWFHIAGDSPPQAIARSLIDFADMTLTSNPYSHTLPVVQKALKQGHQLDMVYDPADFERLAGLTPIGHTTFNVGYIGTVDFVKMHPRYVAMSAAVAIPQVRFIVCGKGGMNDDTLQILKQQVRILGKDENFDFRGYVEDIRSVIGLFDVYGYPLCEDTYASSEANLQEIMFAGLAPVVFPYGGVRSLVINGETGLVVTSEREYTQAIEYLYHYPQEAANLGSNARRYAQATFGAENAAVRLNRIYETMMQAPKRERHWSPQALAQAYQQTFPEQGEQSHPCDVSAAVMFVEALGPYGFAYLTSLYEREVEKLFSAEAMIAASSQSVLMRSAACGSVFHYRKWYPQDCYLHFWSGLLLRYQQRLAEASAAFSTALQLGFTHWRIYWYLAETAMAMQDLELASSSIQLVLRSAPNFTRAQELADRIKWEQRE